MMMRSRIGRSAAVLALMLGAESFAPATAQDRPSPSSASQTANLTAEDMLEIQDLAIRYNYAADKGDGDAMAALFTEDGIHQEGQENDFFIKNAHGRAAIARGT